MFYYDILPLVLKLEAALLRERFAWCGGPHPEKEGWKCALVECGAQSAMTDGAVLMLVWSVDNWVIPQSVWMSIQLVILQNE